MTRRLLGKVIVEGEAQGLAMVSTENLAFSLVDPASGIVRQPGHPWQGMSVAGKVLFFPRLGFDLQPLERPLLRPDIRDPGSRNISLDVHGKLKGATGDAATQIGVPGIHAGIDQGNSSSRSPRALVGVRDAEGAEVGLQVVQRVVVGRACLSGV